MNSIPIASRIASRFLALVASARERLGFERVAPVAYRSIAPRRRLIPLPVAPAIEAHGRATADGRRRATQSSVRRTQDEWADA